MRKILLLFLAFLPTLLFADNVSQEKAQVIAEQFFTSSKAQMRYSSSSMPSLRMIWNGENDVTRTQQAPAFYVFNNENGKGFVIVSGDDCTTSPILAYSFDQNFSADDMPDNVSNWMNGIRSEINEARAKGIASRRNAMFEHNDRTPIVRLETALWDQRSPYNSQLPMGYVTGCPATAISIIMRYHKWPEKGVGVIPESNDKIGAVELGHTYDWDNMPLTYNDMPTDYQKEQVGVLMRDVGAMVRTQYGGGTAGANPEETLPQLMPIYMRYNAQTIKSYFKRDFSDNEWHAILQKELDEKRPILYGGYSTGGGHQFVLDGYATDNYYHVNWGWSGVSNGYYLLTDMCPPEQGAGGSMSADGFTQKQDAIIGIQPDPENPGGGHFDQIAYKGYPGKPYGITADVTEFEINKEFNVTLKEYQNKGSRAFAGNIAVAHFAYDGTMKGIICSKITDYTNYPQEINDFTENYYKCTITETIEDGDYIAGVFKYQNPSEWTMIRNGYLMNDKCTEKIDIKSGDAPAPIDKNILKVMVSKGGYVTCDGQKIEGTVNVEAKPNQSFEILIYPEKGYTLKQVMFGINDVTALAKNNRYVTPKISENTTLQITFEATPIATHKVEIIAGEGGKVVYDGEDIVASSKDIEVESGSQVSLAIIPNTDYEAKVMLNGNDVTSNVTDGIYTSPVITSDTKIEVTFAVEAGIYDAHTNNVKIYTDNGILVIEGAEGTIEVFSTTGTKIRTVEATPITKISIASNAYIIRIADKTLKIVL